MTLVGQQAPDFTAKAVVGTDIVSYTLSDNWNDGKYTLLFFYPKDFTFVCPTELVAFQDRLQDFATRDCNVVACSTDQEFSHFAWNQVPRDQGGLGGVTYPIVADTTKDIATAFGVLHPTDKVAFRGLFLIDANGVVRHMLVNDMPLGRSVDEALRTLEALQHVEAHGEVCPANWTQGSATIKPGVESSKEYFASQGKTVVAN